MSDLEATRTGGPAAAPISQLAQGKLRSLSARSTPTVDHEGVLDAFAEVFARISQTAPALPQTDQSEPHSPRRDLDPADASESGQQVDAGSDHDETSDADEGTWQRIIDIDPPGTTTEIEGNSIVGQAQRHEAERSSQDDRETLASSEDPAIHGAVTTDRVATVPTSIAGDAGDDRRAEKKSQQPAASLESNSSSEPAATERVRTDSSPADNRLGSPSDAEPSTIGVGNPSESDGESGDHRRRRSNQARGDHHQPLREVSEARNADSKASIARPGEQRGGVLNEASSESVSKTPPAPPAEVNKAAVAALTGAPAAASTSVSKATSPPSSLGNRLSTNGLTPTHDPSAAAKPATKSDPAGKSGTNASDAVNRVKLIQRVSKAFQHLGPDGGVVRLRLAPAELGTVRVEMRIDGRKMNARVVAETEAASSALREHLPDLRARLESFGMQIERIEIETDSGQTDLDGRFAANQHDGRRSDQQGHRPRSRATPRDEAVSRSVSSPATVGATGSTVTLPGTGVDLRL